MSEYGALEFVMSSGYRRLLSRVARLEKAVEAADVLAEALNPLVLCTMNDVYRFRSLYHHARAAVEGEGE